jgi:uncharacterized membrane protein
MRYRHPLDPPPHSLTRRVIGNALIYGPFVIASGCLLAFLLWQWLVPTLFGIAFIVVSIVSALIGAALLAEDEQ